MGPGWSRMVRAGGAMIGAMLLSGAAIAQGERYEVVAFQPADAALADMKPTVLPLAMITRPEAGKEAIYIETDQAGAARVQKAAQGPVLVYKALAPHVQASAAAKASAASLVPGAKGEPQTYYLFAHVEGAEGKDQVFNDFYTATHQPQVLELPGMQWSVRGKLISQTPATFKAPGYFAMYEFKSYDLKASMAEFDRRMKEKVITPFPEGAVGPNLLVYWAGPVAPAAAHHHH
jgi:hypothetical protein